MYTNDKPLEIPKFSLLMNYKSSDINCPVIDTQISSIDNVILPLTEATGSSIIYFYQNNTYLVINPGPQPVKIIVYLVGISSGDARYYARYTIIIE
jgi:hypothetical protein